MPSLVLASASPRRRELLIQLGVTFTIAPQDIDESLLENETASVYVERLARSKALNAAKALGENAVVLAADTTVVAGDTILAKPVNEAEGLRMLSLLSGVQHKVFTGIAVAHGDVLLSEVVETRVTFKALTEAEMQDYWATGEPLGKAGAYGIQGYAAAFVESMSGSYSNVVGLPLFETARLLRKFSVPIWQNLGLSGE